MFRKIVLLPLIGLTLLLTGCLGSPEPYRPGWNKRPPQVKLEDAEEQAKRMALPVSIERSNARLALTRKEVAKTLGNVSRNPWNSYRRDMIHVLSKPIAQPYLPWRLDDPESASAADEGEEGEAEEGESEEWDEEEDEEYEEDEDW